jgi:hypothetical protein
LEITSLGVWELSVIEKEEVTKKPIFEGENRFKELEQEEELEGPPGLVDESEEGELQLESDEEVSELECFYCKQPGHKIQECACEFETYPVPVPESRRGENHGGECEGECCASGFIRVKKKKRLWKKLLLGDMTEEECNEKWIQPVEGEEKKGDKKCMGLTFQVADVKKPLVAVKRITEKGNWVVFGPGKEDNYIENKITGDKMLLTPNGRGAFVMDVSFVGGNKTTITVDSGAEESVCPWNWGHELFGTRDASQWMTFRNANGGSIEHYGARDVKVVSTF